MVFTSFLTFLFFSLFSLSVFANVGLDYGLGSRTAGLARAGGTTGFAGSFNAFHNPAALVQEVLPAHPLQMDYAFLFIQPSFKSIHNVVLHNAFDQGLPPGSPQYGDVDISYEPVLGHSLGMSYLLFPQALKWSFGLNAFFPLKHLASLDTGDSMRPEYLLYRNRSQNPQIEMASGIALSKELSVGAGLQVAYTMTSRAEATLSATTGIPTSVRTMARMKPYLVPYLGLLWTTENSFLERLGLVVRLPARYDHFMNLDSYAKIAALSSSFSFQLKGDSTFLYDPLVVHLGTAWQWSKGRRRLFLDLDYQMWRDYLSPLLILQAQQKTGTVVVEPGFSPGVSYQSLWVPMIGHELSVSEHTVLRLGYRYQDSILQQGANIGNFLDPPKHVLTTGIGLLFQTLFGHAIPHRFDAHVLYGHLATQTIQKSPGNEAGNPSDLKIGAPGYSAGGTLYGVGFSLSLVL